MWALAAQFCIFRQDVESQVLSDASLWSIGVQTLDTKHLSAEKSGCDVNVNDASLRRILRDIN